MSEQELEPCKNCGAPVPDDLPEKCAGHWNIECVNDLCLERPSVMSKTRAMAIHFWNQMQRPNTLQANNKALLKALEYVPQDLKHIADYIRLMEINNRTKSGNAAAVDGIAAKLTAAISQEKVTQS